MKTQFKVENIFDKTCCLLHQAPMKFLITKSLKRSPGHRQWTGQGVPDPSRSPSCCSRHSQSCWPFLNSFLCFIKLYFHCKQNIMYYLNEHYCQFVSMPRRDKSSTLPSPLSSFIPPLTLSLSLSLSALSWHCADAASCPRSLTLRWVTLSLRFLE